MGKETGTEEEHGGSMDRAALDKAQDEDGKALLTKVTAKDDVVFEMVEDESLLLRYKLTEIPPVAVSVFIALQHVLVSLASALTLSSVIADTLCAGPSHSIRAHLFATTLFMQGLCTVVQTTIGVRLPVFQGPSSSFLVPLIALKQSSGWECQDSQASSQDSYNNGVEVNSTMLLNTTTTPHLEFLSMETKLQQLSGSLMLASLLEVVIGGLGLIRPLLRFIGPITVAPTIALIGLSLFKLPVMYAKFNPAIGLASAMLVVIFSLYLSKVQIPIPGCGKGSKRTYLPIFELLPILLAMGVMWLVSYLLTVTDVIPNNEHHPYYLSRTDSRLSLISSTPWFHFSYPGQFQPPSLNAAAPILSTAILLTCFGFLSGQFGPPSINVAATIGFSAAVLSSLIESVGDYYAAAKCCDVMPPPDHAMSRGVLVEGLGSFLSGAVGAAHATTSYSGNIAMLSLTKTASRSVLVLAGVTSIALSFVGKAGAAMATVPAPILGGVIFVVMGLLTSVGLSTLKYADMTSNRNLLITGVAFMSGLSIPSFTEDHGEMLATGNTYADQVIRVVLGTPMFLGGVIAMILDNTVPGTDIERGLSGWKMSHSTNTTSRETKEDSATTDNNNHSNNNLNGKEAGSSTDKTETQPEEDIREITEVPELTEDDVYAFRPLKGRLTSPLWRYIPFVPPNAMRRNTSRYSS